MIFGPRLETSISLAASAIKRIAEAVHKPAHTRREALAEIRIRLEEAEKQLKD